MKEKVKPYNSHINIQYPISIKFVSNINSYGFILILKKINIKDEKQK